MLAHVFGDVVWVEGEIVDLTRSAAGHVYFRLVEPDDPDSGTPRSPAARPSLAVTLFDSQRQQVNRFLQAQGDPIRMTDGLRIRIGGRLGTYAARSSLQLLMDRIDPAFTLGLLGADRARLIAALTREGLLRANAEVHLPSVALRVGLVTSVGSAAHADALHELESSGIGFHVQVFDARTQGSDAPGSITRAIRAAAAHGVEVVLLVRGGGATTDLVAFDDEAVARTIATSDVAVITGIGHETDRSVADEVAHTAQKTPTAAAQMLVRTVRDAERRILDRWAAARAGTHGGLDRAEVRLDRIRERTGARAVARLDRSALELDHRVRRIHSGARRRIERADARTELIAVSTAALDPALAMRRGWSITRGADGSLVRSVDALATNQELITTLADGTVTSSVLGITPAARDPTVRAEGADPGGEPHG